MACSRQNHNTSIMQIITIKDLLKSPILPNSTTPRLDLEILISFVLGKPRAFLYSHPETLLTQEQRNKLEKLIKRRQTGEPIAYITGIKEFWSLELIVNQSVLIPRPETEMLVELALEKITSKVAVVADLGTGSGAIALALAKEKPDWQIIATDFSQLALDTAEHNAKKLQLSNVKFYLGDWCEALPGLKFDLIISNPPYITPDDPHLLQEDIKFEPQNALISDNGLKDLTQIIIQAKNKLKPGGWLMLEHGHDQSQAVQDLLCQQQYKNIMPYKDMAHINRVAIACK